MLKIASTLLLGILTTFMVSFFSYQSDQIKDFTLPNVLDGSSFSLSQYKDSKAVVVIFTSFYCPYAKFYEDRIATLTDKYRNNSNIRVILINPNNPDKSKADATSNVESEIKRLRFGVPFLTDSSQQVADLLGAEKTPEAFILVPSNGSFRIVYQGAIDDNPQVQEDVKHHYLETALSQITEGSKVAVNSTPVTGCIIRR